MKTKQQNNLNAEAKENQQFDWWALPEPEHQAPTDILKSLGWSHHGV